MQLISSQMIGYMERSSWIRKMFEEGIRLKQEFGEDAICDFSLGNPDLPPSGAAGPLGAGLWFRPGTGVGGKCCTGLADARRLPVALGDDLAGPDVLSVRRGVPAYRSVG